MPNFDETTGYRFGVISPHSISPDALDDVYMNGSDPVYEAGKEEFTSKIRAILDEYNFSVGQIDEVLSPAIDIFNESYPGSEDGQCDYSDKEYTLHVSGDNFGIFVMKSPYYTYCRGCSPCAPGAGDLDSPVDGPDLKNKDMIRYIDQFGTAHKIAEKTLCLGPDWFENEKAPYRVFRVDNDEEVL